MVSLNFFIYSLILISFRMDLQMNYREYSLTVFSDSKFSGVRSCSAEYCLVSSNHQLAQFQFLIHHLTNHLLPNCRLLPNCLKNHHHLSFLKLLILIVRIIRRFVDLFWLNIFFRQLIYLFRQC